MTRKYLVVGKPGRVAEFYCMVIICPYHTVIDGGCLLASRSSDEFLLPAHLAATDLCELHVPGMGCSSLHSQAQCKSLAS